MVDEIAILRTKYERFNAKDFEGVLVAMAEDVEWANGMEGGYVCGKNSVREYWTRQWAQVSPRIEPLSFDPRGRGELAVQVQQAIFDLSGQPLAVSGGLHSQIVGHVFGLMPARLFASISKTVLDHDRGLSPAAVQRMLLFPRLVSGSF